MALVPTVLTNAYISIATNVISDHATHVEFNVTVDDEEVTAFGQTYKARVGGLKDGQLSITFLNDYQAANLDSIMWALVGTVVAFEIRPDAGSVSTSNPKYTGSILINSWKPISGDVGKTSTVDVSFLTSGTITRATS